MAGFLFRLETVDGRSRRAAEARGRSPELERGRHDPPGHKALRVVGVRDDDADQPPVLVVEDVAE